MPLDTPTSSGRTAAVLIATWGVGGVVLLITHALVRLTPLALEPLRNGNLLWWQALLYVAWVVLNAYGEGYRGFQKSFCPRLITRAFWLARHPRPLHVILAPAYSMSLIDAPRRDRNAAWLLVLGIVALVVLVHRLPQPWRGIVDGGVVVGLAWGLLATVAQFVRGLAGTAVRLD